MIHSEKNIQSLPYYVVFEVHFVIFFSSTWLPSFLFEEWGWSLSLWLIQARMAQFIHLEHVPHAFTLNQLRLSRQEKEPPSFWMKLQRKFRMRPPDDDEPRYFLFLAYIKTA
jgi:hypothetical protein